jgi:hypothetical protein
MQSQDSNVNIETRRPIAKKQLCTQVTAVTDSDVRPGFIEPLEHFLQVKLHS